MQIIPTITEMRSALWTSQQRERIIGFVPTMGALHEGHLSLVRAAKEKCHVVAVSIFVNPTQFAPGEDFTRYPRTFDADCTALEKEKIDFLFAPSAEEMYPPGATTYVKVEEIADRLCGRSRPGHFRGVATVVSKLFNIVQPDFAFFGLKDAAQFAVIRRMVRDLNIPVEIVGCPIVRESDGLAMSSRNVYLSGEERRQALVLSRALKNVEESFHAGECDTQKLIALANQVIAAEPAVRLDYFEIVDPDSLKPLSTIGDQPALAAVAAFVGNTRLIDNTLLHTKALSS
jgi:pantoate--beta-alanine ligase